MNFASVFNLCRMNVYIKEITVNLWDGDMYNNLSTYLIFNKLNGTQMCFISTPE